jgi:hypothetical protein
VNIAARILQAAILKGAVDKHPVIQNHVLVFEDLVFVSGHREIGSFFH